MRQKIDFLAFWSLATVAVVLQCLDWYSTLAFRGRKLEVNRVVIWLIDHLGWNAGVSLAKVVSLCLLGFMIWWSYKRRLGISIALLLLLDGLLAIVMILNFEGV